MPAATQSIWREAWENTKAFSLAAVVHALAAALIVLGTLNWTPFRPPQITGMTIEAVIVDTQALKDRRDAAQREAEEAVRREQARQQRQRDLEIQRQREQDAAAEAERERQRQEVRRQRDAEMRLQQLREQQERDRQDQLRQQQQELEELRKQRVEAERQRKIEEERMKQLENRREQERETQRQAEAEAARQQQRDAEQRAFQAGQLATLGDEYYAAIQAQVTSNWLRPPTARPGLRCTLAIVQIPGGEVISAQIRGTCNGDEATRRSLEAAVERAGALPYRGFEDVFQREIDFIFTYDGD
jgi:colicin import membrane protein